METKIELQATVTKELSDELYNKLDGNEFANEIDKLTKEFKINWYLNPETKALVASQTFVNADEISHAHIYSFHADVCEFVSKVEKLTHKESMPAVSDKQANQAIEDYEFIKNLVDEWDETEEQAATAGFVIMAEVIPDKLYLPCGQIKNELAKELCICYLKVHGHDK